MTIEEIRIELAKAAGLIDCGWKYNKPDREIKEGRFYCRKEDWRPDEDWNQWCFLKYGNMSQMALTVEFSELMENIIKAK